MSCNGTLGRFLIYFVKFRGMGGGGFRSDNAYVGEAVGCFSS